MKSIVDHVRSSKDIPGIVIFSQFTLFLDLLHTVFKHEFPDRTIFTYDGRMSTSKRNKSVQDFNSRTDNRIMLISLQSGGVGLSLHHNASHVMLCEPYYNLSLEQQAEERVHRIGQKRQVEVFRFYANSSIDMWMKKMKERKIMKRVKLVLYKLI